MEKVIISTSKIYTQIALFSGNSAREKELKILVKALSSKHCGKIPLFVKMSKDDVERCFQYIQ